MSLRGKAYWSTKESSFESDYLEAEIIKVTAGELISLKTIDIKVINCGVDYSVIVKAAPQDGWVQGHWLDRKGGVEGRCEGRVYWHPDHSVIIFGTWWESGIQYEWFTFLK